jgi:hypothetical protein
MLLETTEDDNEDENKEKNEDENIVNVTQAILNTQTDMVHSTGEQPIIETTVTVIEKTVDDIPKFNLLSLSTPTK